MIKIYFCGSIRGGRELARVYQEIIEILKDKGEVLTEHVGDEEEVSEDDLHLSDQQIHDRDLQWIRESDVMVAEVTIPSLGVGYEIGRALEMSLPIICLFNGNSQNKLSAMIGGSDGVEMHTYTDNTKLSKVLKEFIERHAPHRTS